MAPKSPLLRHRGGILALLIFVFAGPSAGCGGTDPDQRPSDFAITVRHASGSVPPPGHTEWTLEVDAAGRGALAYLPDYEGPGVPTFRARFMVDEAKRDALYMRLAELDLLRTQAVDENPPVGGSTESATVVADGQTYEVPTFADGAAPLEPVSEEIDALVPSSVWERIYRRRDAYDQRRYGQAP